MPRWDATRFTIVSRYLNRFIVLLSIDYTLLLYWNEVSKK